MIHDDIVLECDLCHPNVRDLTINTYNSVDYPRKAVDDGWEFFVRMEPDPGAGRVKDNGKPSLVACPKCSDDRWAD